MFGRFFCCSNVGEGHLVCLMDHLVTANQTDGIREGEKIRYYLPENRRKQDAGR